MILRAIPLKDATKTAVTSCGVGTIFDAGAVYNGMRAYAAVQILACSTGGLKVRIQNSSSSGGGGMTDVFVFTSCSGRLAQWAPPLTTGTLASTFQHFWRAVWECTTSGESYNFLTYFGIQAP